MMKIVNQILAGAKRAPAFIIILYYLFVALDMCTTYLASPDLKYEVNWIVLYFNLNWTQIIILASVNSIITGSLFLISLNYVHRFFQDNSIKHYNTLKTKIIQKSKIIVSIILLCIFYSHLFVSVFVTINNYLNFIYLFRKENPIITIATCYVKIETFFFPHYYIYTQILFITAGYVFTAFIVRRIRNKYRTIPV